MKKHLVRFTMLLALTFISATPAYADECTEYCEGFAEGFCGATGQEAEYQGCETNSEGGYDCYFGCTPIE